MSVKPEDSLPNESLSAPSAAGNTSAKPANATSLPAGLSANSASSGSTASGLPSEKTTSNVPGSPSMPNDSSPNASSPPSENQLDKSDEHEESGDELHEGEEGEYVGPPPPPPRDLAAESPWPYYLVPFIVFMIFTSFEPKAPEKGMTAEQRSAEKRIEWLPDWAEITYDQYPYVYSLKILATLGAMAYALPMYRLFPLRISPLALGIGLVGGVAWVGICEADHALDPLGAIGFQSFQEQGIRSAFNPLEEIKNPAGAWGFLLVRFFGLVLIVPILEEFFLRGFVMRIAIDEAWWEVPFGKITPIAAVVGTVVPVLMHTNEILASIVWFSLITWLMVRTKNIWDCVAAHAVTNLVLGIYVVTSDRWWMM